MARAEAIAKSFGGQKVGGSRTAHIPVHAPPASGLPGLDLPGDVRHVIILADGDDTGEKAAQKAGRRWKREGRSVHIARPLRGMDFNAMPTHPELCKLTTP